MDNCLTYYINQGHQTLNLVNKDASLNHICERTLVPSIYNIDYKTTTSTAPSAI